VQLREQVRNEAARLIRDLAPHAAANREEFLARPSNLRAVLGFRNDNHHCRVVAVNRRVWSPWQIQHSWLI